MILQTQMVSTNRVKTGEFAFCVPEDYWLTSSIARIFRTVEITDGRSRGYPGYSYDETVTVTKTYSKDGYTHGGNGTDGCLQVAPVTAETSTGQVEASGCFSGASSCYATYSDGAWSDNGVCLMCYAPYFGETRYFLDECTETSKRERWASTPVSGAYASIKIQALSDEYATGELIAEWMGDLQSLVWPTNWSSDASACRDLSANERCVSGSRMKYRIRFVLPKGERADIKWYEVFTPAGGGDIVRVEMSEQVVGTGSVQYTRQRIVEPPSKNGCTTVELPDCPTVASCAFGSGKASLSSVHVTVNLGKNFEGRSVGVLLLHAEIPSGQLYSPAGLQTLVDASGTSFYSGDILRQVKVPDGLVDLVTNSTPGYQMRFYQNPGTLNSGSGLYQGFSGLLATWTFQKVGGSNWLRVTHFDGEVSDFRWLGNGWEFWQANNLFRETVISSVNGAVETRRRLSPNSQVAFQEQVTFLTNWASGVRLVSERIQGTGPESVTNRWHYHLALTTNHVNYGKLSMSIDSRGGWERYSYHGTNGRLEKIVKVFGNAATNAAENISRVTEYNYAPVGTGDDGSFGPDTPRTIVEKLKGFEVGRRYVVLRPSERRDVVCVLTNASWNSSSNLFTITRRYTLANGEADSIVHENGTATITQTLTNSAGTYETNVVYTGKPNNSTNATTILDGTVTTSITERPSKTLSRVTKDIISSIVFAREIYSDFDSQGRPRRTDYLDGTFTTNRYHECCSQSAFRDRDGVLTEYAYDALDRLLTTKRLGITISNVYDAAGNLLETRRLGASGSPIKLHTATHDLAGRRKTTADAVGNTTSISYSFDAFGRFVTTTIYPNTGIRLQYENKDGTLAEIAGTAAVGMAHEYDIEAQDGFHRPYVKQIQVPTTHWTKTYMDPAGRNYKTVHASASGPYPYQQSFFDSKGQLTRQIDFGLVTNLYVYNAFGEVGIAAIDFDGNGVWNVTSMDRITRNDAIFTNDNGLHVRRILTTIWPSNNVNASAISAITQVSSNGLLTWNVSFGLTSRVGVAFAGGGYRYVTNTAPDNSRRLETFQNGRLVSVNSFASDGASLGGETYAYDGHGRQTTTTDIRTGTVTTRLYDNADRVVTNKVESPGLLAQLTVNYYDNMGRVWRTLLPDGGNVTNEYTLRGELNKSYGTRTYPVEYGYDAQGRMTNMTTWRDFSGNSGKAATTWTYDGYRGFLISKRYADNTGPNYSYDAAGRLLTRQWARGITTSYSYTPASDLKGVNYSDTTADVTYTHDRLGRPTTITQGGQPTVSFIRDLRGNVLSERYTAGILNGLTVSNRYDSLQRRTTNGVRNGSAWLTQTRYTYSSAGRLDVASDGTNSATYAYLANSPLVSQINFKSNGSLRLTTTRSYDNLNRLTGIMSSNGVAGAVSSHGYQYNLANQRTRVSRQDGSSWLYEYDALGQVIRGRRYWADGTPVAGQQYEFAFDDIGNRETAGHGGDQFNANSHYQHYSVNSLNQYLSRTVPGSVDILGAAHSNSTVTVLSGGSGAAPPYPNGMPGIYPATRKSEYFRSEVFFNNSTGLVSLLITNLGVLTNGTGRDITTTNSGQWLIPQTPESFTHDLDGNLTGNGLWTRTWNGENRCIATESRLNVPVAARRKSALTYDWQGRRVQKLVSTNNGSTWVAESTNKFIYDGWNLLAELNPANAVVRAYLWGLDLGDVAGTEQGAGGVGGLLVVNGQTNGIHFVAMDGNGNVGALISANNSSVTAQYDYPPFGQTLMADGALARQQPFRFSTKFHDEETRTVYYGYRDYDPETGRWLNRDPLGEPGFELLTGASQPTRAEEENDDAEGDNSFTPSENLNLYRFVSNDPISAFDALGLWELRCRPLQGVGRVTGQKHCWIECDGKSYSLLNKNGTATKVIDDPADKGKGSVVASGSGNCACIQKHFNENNQTYSYDKDQCNSNYYAHQLLRCCGISVSRPSGGYGWDDCDDKSKAFKCFPCTN